MTPADRPPARPARLRAGSRVALISPAGPVDEASIEVALSRCEAFGFEPLLAPSARERTGYLAGPDVQRAADVQAAIDDPAVDALWALRGGYGTMRILERIDLARLADRPRPFIGFSDNTALHGAIARAGVVTFHGPHAGNAFPAFTETCFRRVLMEGATGALPRLEVAHGAPMSALAGGIAEGRLAGGNLSMLGALCGTPWAPRLRDRILVLEDVGEAAYRVDRLWTQLRLAGCLEGVRGIVLGRFTGRPEKPGDPPFGDVIRELAGPLGVPVLVDAPVGHVDHQWTLPLGILARVDADACTLSLLEPAVS